MNEQSDGCERAEMWEAIARKLEGLLRRAYADTDPDHVPLDVVSILASLGEGSEEAERL